MADPALRLLIKEHDVDNSGSIDTVDEMIHLLQVAQDRRRRSDPAGAG